MKERAPDDTPKPDPPPQRERGRETGDYYYDDATGYEVYKPDNEDNDDDQESPRELGPPGSAGILPAKACYQHA